MQAAELVATFPRLYHMAEAGSWPMIASHGLLSTSRLLDLFEVTAQERDRIESQRRPDSVPLYHASIGLAVVRDNKPLSEAKLESCLVEMTPRDFYRLLNQRVFFWLTEERLETLLGARAYRGREHTIITVDTERLVTRHSNSITLSAINSGATVYKAQPRGQSTFQPVASYDFESWRQRRGRSRAIAELAVTGGVTDILQVALTAHHRHADGSRDLLWSRY